MSRYLSVRRALLALLLCILAVAQLGPMLTPTRYADAAKSGAAAVAQVMPQTLFSGAGYIKIERASQNAGGQTLRPNVQTTDNTLRAASGFDVEGFNIPALQGTVNIYAYPHAATAAPLISSLYMALTGHFKVGPYTTLPRGQYDLSVTDSKGAVIFAPKVFRIGANNPHYLANAAVTHAAPQITPAIRPLDAPCPPGTPLALGPASLYSVFMLGDLTLRHSDFQGAVAAGGNVFLGDAFSIGESLTPTDTAALSQTNGAPDVLIAGGNLTASYYDPRVGVTQYGNIQHGNAVYSGTYTLEPITVTPFLTPTVVHAPSPIDFTAAGDELTALSDYYASLPSPGGVTHPAGAGGFITLTGASPTLNVFTISSRDLSLASTQGVSIDAPAGSTVLVNVIPDAGSGGTAADLGNYKSFPLQGVDSRHVLYNIPLAATLSFGNEDLHGSILAPRATVSFMNGALFGALVGKAWLDVAPPNSTGEVELPPNSTGQVNLPPFQGCIPRPNTQTPTPVATTAVPTSVPTTPVPTNTSTNTAVPTNTSTNTAVPTNTNTNTPVPTSTSTNTAVPTSTNTPNGSATPTATGSAVSTSTSANTAVPTDTSTNTPVPTNTNTNTNTPVPTNTSANTAVPTNTSINTPMPTSTPTMGGGGGGGGGGGEVAGAVHAPSATPTPHKAGISRPTPHKAGISRPTPHKAGISRPAAKPQVKYVTKVVTKVRTVTQYRTVTRYRYVTVTKVVTKVRHNTVVNHKTVITYKTVVKPVTKVTYRVVTVVHHVTKVMEVKALRIVRHPVTGRFGGPQQVWHGAIPPVEARFGIARLGISWAPVWSRDFIQTGWNAFTYDIVPQYGVTRFSPSAPFGQPGLSMLSGHDDIDGKIFRNLGSMRLGDAIVVNQGTHVYRYIVTSVRVVTPDNVAMLNAPYARPTLALISCTPYMVDTHRVVVIAQLQK